MKTMYELIMDFPLFKGIGRKRVSALLEKYRIEFKNYAVGDVVAGSGDPCNEVCFIVRGRAKVVRTSASEDFGISYTLGEGAVIGADTLFGWHTTFSDYVVATAPLALLVFHKDAYLTLILSDEIYLMNYINYISMHLQMSNRAISMFAGSDLLSVAARWVMAMTDRYSEDILIAAEQRDAADLESLQTALEKRVLLARTDGFAVPDRRLFLEFAEQQLTQ